MKARINKSGAHNDSTNRKALNLFDYEKIFPEKPRECVEAYIPKAQLNRFEDARVLFNSRL